MLRYGIANWHCWTYSKGNPEPWRDVQPRQQTKMYTTAGAREHFDSQYSRSRL